MKAVVSVEQMRRMDRDEIEAGTSAAELMRRAGEAALAAFPWGDGTVILCGNGNNGGDGFVLASLLAKKGVSCRLVLLEENRSEVAKGYFEECMSLCVPWSIFSDEETLSDATAVADCLFGTGFRGEVIGRAKALIDRVNLLQVPILSVDINSGMNGDSGIGGAVVRSTKTLAIGSFKYGHFLGDAKDVIGELACADIGIPLCADHHTHLIEAADCACLFPKRKQNSHKGSYGYVGILGGCAEYAGAAKLANLSCAALRSGCGVVTLAVPKGLENSVSPYLLESTLLPLSDDGNGHARLVPNELDRFLQGKRAIAVGMGWGRSPENRRILAYLLEHAEIPMVIDADGLNTLAEMERSWIRRAAGRLILTPHPKELERLSGLTVQQILEDPVTAAEGYAGENGVILLLKGPCTVVTDGSKTYLVDRGCAGMATAGSGDVLSGVLAGLLGASEPTAKTVACGAYLTGLAGELAERDVNAVSMLASDTVAHLPMAVSMLMTK